MDGTLFNEPLSDEERAEIAAMPSHELYILSIMVPINTLRGRIVHDLYADCRRREIRAGLSV